MISIANPEVKKATVSSLITCIYLPSVITVISYNDLLYSIGKRSSFFVLVLIFLVESVKALYLRESPTTGIGLKRNKHVKNRASDFLRSFVFVLCMVVVFFIGIIIFGAPVLENHEGTLILSVLLTLLTTFPLVAHVGVDMSVYLLLGIKEYNKWSITEMYVNNALLSICGGWIGAVVIPLDWNRPWQQWPIPCYLGVIGGYLLSNVLTIVKVILVSAANKYQGLNAVVNFIYKTPGSK